MPDRREALALLGAAPFAARAQSLPPGPHVLTFRSHLDQTEQPYALYVPPPSSTGAPYPLIVALHNEGSNHRLALRRAFGRGNLPGESDAEASRRFPPLPEVNALVAAPFARGSLGYQGLGEIDVLEMMEDVKRRFPVDPDRIALTGAGLGGGGALWLAATRPDLWSAVAAICPDAPPETRELAGNLLPLPVRLYQGELDPVVLKASTRRWHKELLDLGVAVEYIEYPGVRHNAWDYAYRNGELLRSLAQLRRVRLADRVRFAALDHGHGQGEWVQLNRLTPGTRALVDARFTARNQVAVTTEAVDAFSLTVEQHPRRDRRQPLSIIADGQRLRLPPGPVRLERSQGRWRAAPPASAQRQATGKTRGREGPIRAAIFDRHVYVYGTADAPSAPERERRREQALTAARWTGAQMRIFVNFPVKADDEVTNEELLSAHVVLFGTRLTNRLVDRFAAEFPLELDPGAADFGLLFIAPLPTSRYALVSSGLPWWQGADTVARPGPRHLSLPLQLLYGFGDYVVFRGSLANTIADGRFTNEWRLPPEVAGQLAAVPAVRVR